MTAIEERAKASRRKRDLRIFTIKDVELSVRRRAKPGAKVFAPKKGVWTRISKWQLLVTELSGGFEDAYARIVVRPHKPFLNWLLLPWARFNDKGKWVTWGHKVHGTNILLDVWYVGDGSEGVPLMVEAK